ncbi:type II secretion system F family protein [Gorillibacterium timonense]|uniref:type II secretion system F family protein n=1 Tax=Gorillibacterium timonense TaxID=1689269 RepID=UPI00071C55E9|nr:type II secretion system F family protein [Gorillibacterium timonense]
MPKYRYKAVTSAGKPSAGILESATLQQASEELRSQGLWIMSLKDQEDSLLTRDINVSLGGDKVKLEHFTVFCRQLATMYKSGVSLVESVRLLSEHAPTKPFRKVLAEVAEEMKDGAQFSDAAARHPKTFGPIFVNMVKAGEAGGNLDAMLERLAIFYEKEHNTKQKVKSAMVYPTIMAVVMVLVVTFMMIFVIPKFVDSFASMNVELPLPTRIVIAVSDFMQRFWYLVIAGLFVPKGILTLIRKSETGRERLDYIKLQVPVFGKLWHKQAIARFSRTFSSLFAAAIPLMEGLTLVSQVVANEAIGKVILKLREDIMKGESMSEPLRRNKLFPPMVVEMIAVGEQTGSLDSMLDKVADFYEADVDAMADRLKSLLEPLMILIIAGIVGIIVLAVMTPTFKMIQEMN